MLLTAFTTFIAIFSSLTCRASAEAIQINITVMVPGIQAFAELTRRVSNETYGDYYQADNGIDAEYTMDTPVETVSLATDTTAVMPYEGEDYQYDECENTKNGEIDHICRTGTCIYPWSYVFAKPALDVALETIRNTAGLLDGYELNLRYSDPATMEGCASSRSSQIEFVDAMMQDRMTAMIGPMDAYSMSRVSSFATHWDILNFSPGAISTGLRTEYYKREPPPATLVRTGPVESHAGNCLKSLLHYYNWSSTAAQVLDDNQQERMKYFIAEGIFEQVGMNHGDYKLNQIGLSDYYRKKNGDYDYPLVMKTLNGFARILIISAADVVVRDILKHANQYKVADSDYAFIIIDLDDKLGPKPWEWIGQNGTTMTDDDIKEALDSALIITATKPETVEYSNFVDRLKEQLGRNMESEMAKADFGIAYNESDTLKVAKMMTNNQAALYGARDADEYFRKNQYPAYLHDSLLMLAHVLNSSLAENDTSTQEAIHSQASAPLCGNSKSDIPPKGKHLMKKMIQGQTFQGVSGKISIDEVGDRLLDFSVLDLDPKEGIFKVIGKYDAAKRQYYELPGLSAHWPRGSVPKDVPKCGFNGKKCIKERITLVEAIVISVVSLALVAAIISINTYRRNKLQKELDSQLWRVYWSDITWPISPNGVLGGNLDGDIGALGGLPTDSDPSLGEVISYYVPSLSPAIAAKRAHKRKRKWSSNSRKNERICDVERKTSAGSLISEKAWGGVTTTAVYKDQVVVVKLSNRRKVELSKNVLMELKHIRDITHDHLTRFEGACVEWPHICVLTEYCRKGSLRDILLNDEIQLEWMFRVSLMMDLAKGMSFLHGSPLNSHGNLKSTNCVVDSRFVLKITDYGLSSFRSPPSYEESERQCEKKLWAAPELLRCNSRYAKGTQKGDVYSFGIILQEIALRKGTFYVGGIPLSCKEIVSKVRNGFRPYFRPLIDYSLGEDLCSLMQRCWHEDPNERPDFGQIKKIVEKFNKDNPGNLVENLLHRMEQYAINLEGLVEERTAAYMEEKQKADELLYQMLPVPVVDRLKRGDPVPAEAFESVTILFSDIVGFTSLSAASNPLQIVNLLNDLYTCFDAIIDHFDVYKVETIGDAYMLVSGLPVRNGIRHAAEIARTALALLKAVRNFQIRHRPGDQLKLRIGIHTGSCCAGVVGLKMPRYCLFGDTVNTASRMESSGMPLAIHVSESTKTLLDRFQCFTLQLRGEVPMKGKGMLTTYWLLEESLFDVQSLDDSESRV